MTCVEGAGRGEGGAGVGGADTFATFDSSAGSVVEGPLFETSRGRKVRRSRVTQPPDGRLTISGRERHKGGGLTCASDGALVRPSGTPGACLPVRRRGDGDTRRRDAFTRLRDEVTTGRRESSTMAAADDRSSSGSRATRQLDRRNDPG